MDVLKKYNVLMESKVKATSERGGQVSPQIQMHADSEKSDGCHINHKPSDALILQLWKYSHHHYFT